MLRVIDGLQQVQELTGERYVCVWADVIRDESETSTRTFNNATKTLLSRGYLERCYYSGEDKRKKGGYRITPAGREALATEWSGKSGSRPAEPRKARGLPDMAWSAIRVRRKFTVDELQVLCSADPIFVARDDRLQRKLIQRYVRWLELAGFVQHLTHRDVYLLVRDSGREAPLLRQRRREMYDPNTRTTYPVVTGAGQP